MGGRWKMDEIFFGAGPTEQYFMSKPILLMGHIFPAGKSMFWLWNGLTEWALRVRSGSVVLPVFT
jgi:hypothetical protein